MLSFYYSLCQSGWSSYRTRAVHIEELLSSLPADDYQLWGGFAADTLLQHLAAVTAGFHWVGPGQTHARAVRMIELHSLIWNREAGSAGGDPSGRVHLVHPEPPARVDSVWPNQRAGIILSTTRQCYHSRHKLWRKTFLRCFTEIKLCLLSICSFKHCWCF